MYRPEKKVVERVSSKKKDSVSKYLGRLILNNTLFDIELRNMVNISLNDVNWPAVRPSHLRASCIHSESIIDNLYAGIHFSG